ncbi:MAG TPA: ABC transporter ATP-binding protein [Tepidisphaeraceae bacterium]|nr:ABC transporter ATP-binding protein [Tepidisphaeraceae bacterium]
MSAAIDVRNLTYRYPDGVEALSAIEFAVQPRECVGLIGPNGAGKSTLLQHLNGLLPEDLNGDANLKIMGQPINRATLPEIRRQVGLLFQDPNDQLFCPTVFEDVAFGPRQLGLSESEVRLRVEESLKQIGLPGFENRLPHHLSLGERRRVCLAGLLACKPSILVLDEPTSGLDPGGKRELKSLLRQLDATIIIATHDLELVVELCSRALLLNHGRIVAQGPTVELLSNESLMLSNGLERPHILLHQHPHH